MPVLKLDSVEGLLGYDCSIILAFRVARPAFLSRARSVYLGLRWPVLSVPAPDPVFLFFGVVGLYRVGVYFVGVLARYMVLVSWGVVRWV